MGILWFYGMFVLCVTGPNTLLFLKLGIKREQHYRWLVTLSPETWVTLIRDILGLFNDKISVYWAANSSTCRPRRKIQNSAIVLIALLYFKGV